jgi:4-amino-4-deoxy-L-arabinose transferase-like glycosyltransferase
MPRMSRFRGTCVVVLTVAALALRLWHIGFGLPAWYHPDEPIKVQKALAIAAGALNPHYFWHPSFMLYTTAAAIRLAQWWGIAPDPTHAVLAGRIVNAVLGAVTIPLTFLLGQAIGEVTVGLGAAALLAVAPLHVFCSQYLKEDVPLTFWVVVASLAALGIARRGRYGNYVGGGLSCGAAVATKYTGLLALVLPLLAHRECPSPRPGGLRVIGIATAVGFLLLTPFALVDVVEFARGVAHEGSRAVTGMRTSAISPLPYLWTFHLRYSIAPGLGWLATALALLGFVVAIREPTPGARLLTAFVALGYTVFENSPYKPPPNFDRYVVPLLPFLTVLAMMGILRLRKVSGALAWVALALMLIEPGVRTVRLLNAVDPDTRALAGAWLAANLSKDARVVLEGQLVTDQGDPVVAYVPKITGPHVTYTFSLAQLRDRMADFDYAVASSFIYDRYVRFGAGDAASRRFYRELFENRPAAEFRAAVGSFGFHNPTIRIIRLKPPMHPGSSKPPL